MHLRQDAGIKALEIKALEIKALEIKAFGNQP
jgi:hypothetical protein